MKAHSPFLLRRPACVRLVTALIFSGRAMAQITVTTAADENDTPAGALVSLREALRDSSNGGQITFDATLHGKVLVLTAGEMAVTGKTLTVNATGGFVIEARGLSRIFRVDAGAGLHLTGLTLQGGRAPADGGAILNDGTLSLTDCVLRDNRAADGTTGTPGATGAGGLPGSGPPGGPGGPGSGGGAVSSTGSLSALRCQFTGNVAGAGGTGGTAGYTVDFYTQSYYHGSGGTGGAGGAGGAILNAGPLVLAECIFETNRSGTGGTGGGGAFSWAGGSGTGGKSGNGGAVSQTWGMNVERCSFVGNVCPSGGEPASSSANRGGAGSGTAVFWNSDTATLTNCTFTGNGISESAASADESGGAVAAAGTLLRLVHCTVAGNLVGPASTAAGIVSAGPVQCHNCIVAGNLRNRNSTGAPHWEEVNFSPDTPRSVIPFGPLGGTPGVDAQLGALAITSGPLPVRVPGLTSPALDEGAILSSPPAADQRGLPRAVGAPDLGAVEVQPAENTPRALQSISFPPPASFQESRVVLSATASSGLPVLYEFVSGPAILNGNTLTFTAPGFAAVNASQPGDAATAPALSIVRVIEATHFIPFTPAQSYTVYPQNPSIITLPATTLGGLPVTWSFVGTPGAGATLNGNQLTATSAGSVEIRGQNAGNVQYAAVNSTWTLTFIQGALWWETPPIPAGGPPWFTLVEGSRYALGMTARIVAPHSGPVPVPFLPEGVIPIPSFIPAGQTSMLCQLILPANPQLTNHAREVPTGTGTPLNITLFLANRLNVPLDVFAPARVVAGASTQVDVSSPGVPTDFLFGPPPDLGVRTFTVTASDFDNPAISIPVTLDSATTGTGPYPKKHLRITFPPMNRRVRLAVTTDDGITGQSGPISIGDTNADGDGIDDIVEAALQRAPDQFHPPPLNFETGATGLHAVLASRPLDLKGWTVVVELSTDLLTWTPAPANSITETPNPDGTTERVSVLLPAGASNFARLKVTSP